MPLQNWIKCDHTSFWADCSQEWPEIYIFVTWVRRTLLMWLWSLRMVSGWRLTRWSWLPSAASAWQKQASASTDFYEGNSEQYFGGIWPPGIMLNARIYLANFYTSRKVCSIAYYTIHCRCRSNATVSSSANCNTAKATTQVANAFSECILQITKALSGKAQHCLDIQCVYRPVKCDSPSVQIVIMQKLQITKPFRGNCLYNALYRQIKCDRPSVQIAILKNLQHKLSTSSFTRTLQIGANTTFM